MNATLEEVVVVGYLITRLRQLGRSAPWAIGLASAVLRGSYHLYQGFGAFVGNAVMGVVFGWFFLRTRRVMPLIVAHTILDTVSFVGYACSPGTCPGCPDRLLLLVGRALRVPAAADSVAVAGQPAADLLRRAVRRVRRRGHSRPARRRHRPRPARPSPAGGGGAGRRWWCRRWSARPAGPRRPSRRRRPSARTRAWPRSSRCTNHSDCRSSKIDSRTSSAAPAGAGGSVPSAPSPPRARDRRPVGRPASGPGAAARPGALGRGEQLGAAEGVARGAGRRGTGWGPARCRWSGTGPASGEPRCPDGTGSGRCGPAGPA